MLVCELQKEAKLNENNLLEGVRAKCEEVVDTWPDKEISRPTG